MYGNVVFFRGGGQGEGVILPDRYLRATEEDVLTCPRFGVLLLDLDLAYIAGMLDDLADERLVPTPHFAEDTFNEIDEPAIHPPLIEDTCSTAEWWAIRLDHTERAVNRPENEEYYEEMV